MNALIRDNSVSMAKGVAIILMVMVHAHFSSYGGKFVNMFHMPLFFFMSGYCFKEAYLDNFSGFLKKRLKGAYWPYVKWSMIFLLLHNVFYEINIYNGDYGYNGMVSKYYNEGDFFRHSLAIVTTMSGEEQLLGGYWFLHSYMIAAIISFITLKIFRKNIFMNLTGGGILLLLCVIMLYFNISIPYYDGPKEVLAAFFIVIGYAYKHSKIYATPLVCILVGLILVIIGTEYWQSGMLILTWQKAIPYSISSIAGTLMVFSLCKYISKVPFLEKTLTYIGDRTLAVLTWHFLSFKAVSLLIIFVYALQIKQLAKFPVIDQYAFQGWWMMYLIAGVALSLVVDLLISKAKRIIFNKLQQ